MHRAKQLEEFGFNIFDALHISCAESCEVDIMLTTDDKLLKKAFKFSDKLKVIVKNPYNWLMEVIRK